MDNQELLERLHRVKGEEEIQDEPQEMRKYVVFYVGDAVYALPAEDVREVTFDNVVYYVPFLPPYILGFANRHGQPYTVFDVRLLFKNEKLESGALLVLSIPQDHACLMISDVEEIVKVPLTEVHSITSEDEASKFFMESFSQAGKEIFVLNAIRLLERLERDLD
jgi:chemotaxis signal transduction protein